MSDGEKHWRVCALCKEQVDAAPYSVVWEETVTASQGDVSEQMGTCSICGHVCTRTVLNEKSAAGIDTTLLIVIIAAAVVIIVTAAIVLIIVLRTGRKSGM